MIIFYPMIFKLFRFGLIISFSLICFSVKAQISYNGTPIFKDSIGRTEIPVRFLPNFESSAHLKKAKTNNSKSHLKHAQYAYKHEEAYNISNSGIWQTIADGRRVWRMKISSEGAYSLGLQFSKFKLPTGAMLFVYNDQHSRVLGAYTEQSNKKSGKFAIEPLEGDELILEYVEPLGAEFEAQLEVSAVLHDFKNIFNILRGSDSSVKSSGSCNVNINCAIGDDWQVEKQSVCHIIYGNYIGSGALVNNTNLDGKPYFLTAYHVISSQTVANSAIFYFNYEAANCDSAEGSRSQSITGSDLLATTNHLDFTLLELSQMPPASYSVYYAGWDRSGRTPMNTTCIHHPNGDVKKISLDYDAPITATYTDNNITFDDDAHWHILEWDLGTTEGGSSGSPLFDENHRIIGDLTGGLASCENSVSDYFAKFSESWDNYPEANQQLRVWLDPLDTGVEILNGIDPYDGLRANFSVSDNRICYTNQLRIEDMTQGEPDTYSWDFGEGAVPQNSTEIGPHDITYANPGTKEIILSVTKNRRTVRYHRTILAMDLPIADFEYAVEQKDIYFTNSSIEGETYLWNLDDGTASTDENPVHSYNSFGEYTITLKAENRCGSNSISKTVKMNYNDLIKISPNPSNGIFMLDLSKLVYSEMNWMVYDLKGVKILSGNVANENNLINVDLQGMSTGVYILKLEVDGEIVQRKLLLQN